MYEIELPSLSFADAAGGSGRPAMTAPCLAAHTAVRVRRVTARPLVIASASSW